MIKGHKPVLNVSLDSMYKLYTVIQPGVKQLWRNVSSVCKDFPYCSLGMGFHIFGFLSSTSSPVRQDVVISTLFITQQVKLESVLPTHCAFAIGSPLKYLVGIMSWIVIYRYHGAATKTYTRTSSECQKSEEENRFEEYALFQFYKSVI